MIYDESINKPDTEIRIIPDAKQQLDMATRTLARIAVVCEGALDPELTREQVIGRLKFIHSMAALDEQSEADFDAPDGLAEGP